MKHELDSLENSYDACVALGHIKEKSPDPELAKSLKAMAEKSIDFINRKSKDIPKDSTDWTFVFRDYYESLRGLIDAYLILEGICADTHQCNNAYICLKYPELELDWEFLEAIRLKRNAINYRGKLLTSEDWQELKLKFVLHISCLKNEIDRKLHV